ncbi:unnamed protein product [Lymnaea stagnalis]|uniref:Uncharacterized protein n=1 Tax=Lymnaea stagnalis TaxID=6523 RepID=A0AAV2I4N0_LYMST
MTSFHLQKSCSSKRHSLFVLCLTLTVASRRVRADLDDPMSSWREAKARLKEKILSHKVSTTKISPVDDNVVDLRILFWPIQVLTIDELQQSVTTVSYVELSWRDKVLAWDKMDYENISVLSLDYQDLWHPNMVISNSAHDEDKLLQGNERLLLDDTGRVLMTLPLFSRTSCNLDFTNYPFDKQECDVIVFPLFDECQFTMTTDNVSKLTDPFKINGEWSIEARSADTEMYTWGQKSVPILRVKMLLRRSVLFYIITIMIPMSVTSLMTSLVFWIPPSSGEKVTFLVTIYVSTAVFINFFSDTMPRSMSDLPRITIFLITVMLQCFFALMATLFVIRRYEQEVLEGSRDSRDVDGRQMKDGASRKREEMGELSSKEIGALNITEIGALSSTEIGEPFVEYKSPQKEGLGSKGFGPFFGESALGNHNFPATKMKHGELEDNFSCAKTSPRKVKCQLKAEQWDLIFFVLYHVATVPCFISMLIPLFK